MIAGALAVELMASVLQHPLKLVHMYNTLGVCVIQQVMYYCRGLAPADVGDDDDSEGDSNLGLVPHQVW